MTTYKIVVTATYDEDTVRDLSVADVLVDNFVFAVERGLLTKWLEEAVLDDYSVEVASE